MDSEERMTFAQVREIDFRNTNSSLVVANTVRIKDWYAEGARGEIPF